MKTSLLELDLLGLLTTATLPKDLDWMGNSETLLLLDVLMAGRDGLHKRSVDKLSKAHPEAAKKLYAYSLVEWETDKTGNPVYMVLTDRGEQSAKLLMRIARNLSVAEASCSERAASMLG